MLEVGPEGHDLADEQGLERGQFGVVERGEETDEGVGLIVDREIGGRGEATRDLGEGCSGHAATGARP